MSLTVKHLNSDASFLLTFQPLIPFPPSPGEPNTFTILLDPWLSGLSKIWHPKFSVSRQTAPSCVSTLSELPEPDLVIISQGKSDHCHKGTLTQLPPHVGKADIIAEPSAAKTIRGWRHFNSNKVINLQQYDERPQKSSTVHRIPIPSLGPNGLPGEVTVAFIPQKGDITSLHSAIGITYRAPSYAQPLSTRLPTPPDTPVSPNFSTTSFSSSVGSQRLSVIYSPHGCSYKTLKPYVERHLMHEAAIPLTALLHCFDKVTNAWYLGGTICTGFPGGKEIAEKLCAKIWIGAHDGDKDSSGFANKKVTIEKFGKEDVESVVSPRSEKFPYRKGIGTEVVVLGVGEEIQVRSPGRWMESRLLDDEISEGGDCMDVAAVC